MSFVAWLVAVLLLAATAFAAGCTLAERRTSARWQREWRARTKTFRKPSDVRAECILAADRVLREALETLDGQLHEVPIEHQADRREIDRIVAEAKP